MMIPMTSDDEDYDNEVDDDDDHTMIIGVRVAKGYNGEPVVRILLYS